MSYNNQWPRLAFSVPQLHSGMNTTCRVGTKRLEQHLLGHDDMVALTGEGVPFGKIHVHDVWYMPINIIPANVLMMDANPHCHTMAGLVEVLRERNPEVYPTTLVSVLFFKEI